jgi:hypothetical protein
MLFSKYAKYSSRRFCPVCKKNGKSETEYTSHNTRDENDNPICPLLLEIVCNHCGEKGHIAAKCGRLPALTRSSTQPVASLSQGASLSPVTSPKHSSQAKADDFPVINTKKEDDFPALTSIKKNSPTNASFQYANVAALAKQEVKAAENNLPKHWSPTCEEIETRLRNIVLADECKKEHTNNIYGRTQYLTREQVRDKVRNGCSDIDIDKVYVIDEHDYDDDDNYYADPYECNDGIYDDDDDDDDNN